MDPDSDEGSIANDLVETMKSTLALFVADLARLEDDS